MSRSKAFDQLILGVSGVFLSVCVVFLCVFHARLGPDVWVWMSGCLTVWVWMSGCWYLDVPVSGSGCLVLQVSGSGCPVLQVSGCVGVWVCV